MMKPTLQLLTNLGLVAVVFLVSGINAAATKPETQSLRGKTIRVAIFAADSVWVNDELGEALQAQGILAASFGDMDAERVDLEHEYEMVANGAVHAEWRSTLVQGIQKGRRPRLLLGLDLSSIPGCTQISLLEPPLLSEECKKHVAFTRQQATVGDNYPATIHTIVISEAGPTEGSNGSRQGVPWNAPATSPRLSRTISSTSLLFVALILAMGTAIGYIMFKTRMLTEH